MRVIFYTVNSDFSAALHTGAPLYALNDWWSQRLSKAEKLDTPSQTQSSLMSDLDSVYELQCKCKIIEAQCLCL